MDEVKMGYIVSDGCYSDYTVYGVFSTKEKAEAYAMSVHAYVEEFPLDAPPPLPAGYAFFHVDLFTNGKARAYGTSPYGSLVSDWRWWAEREMVQTGVLHFADGRTEPVMGIKEPRRWICDTAQFRILARDENHAVKIAGECAAVLRNAHEYPDGRSLDESPDVNNPLFAWRPLPGALTGTLPDGFCQNNNAQHSP